MKDEIEKPEYHEFESSLGSNPVHASLNYAELKRRADLKRLEVKKTKELIEKDWGIGDYIGEMSAEIALIDHYSHMEEVEIDPDVRTFWETNKSTLEKMNIRESQTEYLSAYEDWQDLVERMDEKRRSDLGIDHDYQYRLHQAKEQVHSAKEREKSANRALRTAKREVNPLTAAIGVITGMDLQTARKVSDARKGVRDAKKGVRDAKRRLIAVRESRASFEEAKDKLSVKEYAVLRRMSEAKEKMAIIQSAAEDMKKSMAETQRKLRAQYGMLDKYKAIQTLKNSNNYAAISETLRNEDPELFKQVEAIPLALPKNYFKITLEGPLQIQNNEKQLSEMRDKMAEIAKKLPYTVEPAQAGKEISDLTIKDGETVETLEAKMKGITDTSSKEYQQLQMQKEHLSLLNAIAKRKAEIQTLTQEIKTFTGDDKDLQPKLRDLRTKQEHLKVLEAELQKDSFTVTMSQLQEIQALASQKTTIETQKEGMENLNDTAEGLQNSQYVPTPPHSFTISRYYETIIESIKRKKEKYIEDRDGKLLDVAEEPEHDDGERE